ncbi:hypothetical protein YTPLAS72_01750 [Nitrospira sp.]|nr:hypothetical protein YTPLAS72_01750 [Nitrospira sp.]
MKSQKVSGRSRELIPFECACSGKTCYEADALRTELEIILDSADLRIACQVVVSDKQYAGPHWTTTPFMTRKKIKICLTSVQIDRNMAGGLCAIDRDDEIPFFRDLTYPS